MNDSGPVVTAGDAAVRSAERARSVPLPERVAMRIALRRLMRARRIPERRLPERWEPSRSDERVVPPRREFPGPMC